LFDLGKKGLYAEEGAQLVPEVKTRNEKSTAVIATDLDEKDHHNQGQVQSEGEENPENLHPDHVKHYLLTKPQQEVPTIRKKKAAPKSKVMVPPTEPAFVQFAVNQ